MSLVSDYKLIVNQKVGLTDFFDIFSDEDECLELYFNLKFSDCTCKKCGRKVIGNYKRIYRKDKNGTAKKAFRCRSCRTYIYPLSDTIFRKTTVPLHSIFYIIFILCTGRSSMTALNVASEIGISYPTVHRLMLLIRAALGDDGLDKMKGIIEIDEAFIGSGGSKKNNWYSISKSKKPIIGLINRETRYVRVFLVNNRNATTINKLLLDNVEVGSTVYTDSWRGYSELYKWYNHESIDHKSAEWVRDAAHVNNMENFWRHMKRNIRKAHIHISPKYVQQYVNEAAWRHNSIGKTNMQLFNEVLVRTFFRPFAITKSKIKLIHRGKIASIDMERNLIAV